MNTNTVAIAMIVGATVVSGMSLFTLYKLLREERAEHSRRSHEDRKEFLQLVRYRMTQKPAQSEP